MNIISKAEENALYIKLKGDIDHHSVKNAREDIDEMLFKSNPKELYLDLSEIEFMDSAGLGLVLGRYKKQTEHGGIMKIVNPTRRIAQILRLAGVDKIIKIEMRSMQ